LDILQPLRRQALHDLIVECRKHAATKWLHTVPYLGPLRAAALFENLSGEPAVYIVGAGQPQAPAFPTAPVDFLTPF